MTHWRYTRENNWKLMVISGKCGMNFLALNSIMALKFNNLKIYSFMTVLSQCLTGKKNCFVFLNCVYKWWFLIFSSFFFLMLIHRCWNMVSCAFYYFIFVKNLLFIKVNGYVVMASFDSIVMSFLFAGRAGVPMEVMGLMLGEFVDDYTVRVIDVFAMPQSGTVRPQ